MTTTQSTAAEPAIQYPLRGLTVVELCHSIAGPYGGSILAQLGAKVVKVEAAGKGDDARAWGLPALHGASALFQAMNRDKQGLALNLRDTADRDALASFIADGVDVVLQNMRPGAADRLGLGADALMARSPKLVYCNLGAYGSVGPLALHPGYDPLMQAQGGIMSVTGDGREPARAGVSLVDQGAGMWSVIGILAALRQVEQTGRGCVVDTSLFETSLAWMTVHLTGYLAYGEVRRPMGSGIYEIVPHQAFATTDGHIMVAAGNDNLFRKLVDVLGMPHLATDPLLSTNESRIVNRPLVIDPISEVLATHSTRHWMQMLSEAGVPAAPLQKVDQVLQDAQTRALKMVQAVPETDASVIGLPLSFNGNRPACHSAAPKIGEHNALLDSHRRAADHV